MGLSPATVAVKYKDPCEHCGGPLYSRFITGHPVEGILKYTLRRSLVRMKRDLLHSWYCNVCKFGFHGTVAMTKKAPEARPIRRARVDAIRNLRRNGYRFFEWEKPYVGP